MTTLAALAPDSDLVQAAYIVAFVLFIVGVRQGTHPTTAKRGNMIAAVGMAIAVATTLALDGIGNWPLIIGGIVVGTAVGAVASIRVAMTAMPQMVALYNGVGGGAVALIAWSEFREELHQLDIGVDQPDPARDLRPDPVLDGGRLGLLLGLERRLRQAPGPDPDPAAEGAGPAGDQRAAAGRDRRAPASTWGSTTTTPARRSSSAC